MRGARKGGIVANRRTLGKYRLIDLALWLAIELVFESIVVKAASVWFPGQAYYVSVVPAVTAIVYMRWGFWGALHALAGGAITCLNIGASGQWYLIYVVGNALSLLMVGYLKLLGWQSIASDALKSLLYGLVLMLLLQGGKALMCLLCGYPAADTIGLFTPEIITLLFTEIIIWIVRRLDGVFEEQTHYLERLRQQQERERGDGQ